MHILLIIVIIGENANFSTHKTVINKKKLNLTEIYFNNK